GCRALDAARLVLRFVETGELRLTSDGAGGLDGWVPGGRLPSLWRERRDLARWAQELPADDSGATTPMSWQLPYPAEGEICGVPVAAFRGMLATLQRRVDAGPRDRVLVIADEAVASELAELLD